MIAKLLLLVQPFLFSTNLIIGRMAAPDFPPFALAFWRWLSAFLFVLPWIGLPLWQQRRQIWQSRNYFLLAGFLGMGVCGAIVYMGARTTSVVNMGIIYATSPLFIVLIKRIVYGIKLNRLMLVGFVFGLSGLATVIARGQLNNLLSLSFVIGDLWMACAALAWAIYSILQEKNRLNLPKPLILPATILGGIIVLAPFTLYEAIYIARPALSLAHSVQVVILALVASLASYGLYNWLIEKLGANLAGFTIYLTPLSGAIGGYFLLGEPLAMFHWIGLSLVLGGIAFIRAEPKPNASS